MPVDVAFFQVAQKQHCQSSRMKAISALSRSARTASSKPGRSAGLTSFQVAQEMVCQCCTKTTSQALEDIAGKALLLQAEAYDASLLK